MRPDRAARTRRYDENKRRRQEEAERRRQAQQRTHALARRAIEARQGPLPAWFARNEQGILGQEAETVWTYALYVFRRRERRYGERRIREPDGFLRRVTVDPGTGQEWVELWHDPAPSEAILLFRIQVDLATEEVVFLHETTLARLDPDDYELSYDW